MDKHNQLKKQDNVKKHDNCDEIISFNHKRGLLLLSGGIDSPVAGYIMMKRGVDVVAVHFDNQPFSDERSKNLSIRLAKKIGIKKIYIVPYGFFKSDIVKNCLRRFTCIICRRLMFRIASKIAKNEGCDFLITGENLGQVASQTLSNMVSERSASEMIILRPILCNDKNETIDMAKKIGTYDISIEPSICCNLIPPSPATASKISVIEKEESRLSVDEIILKAMNSLEIVTL